MGLSAMNYTLPGAILPRIDYVDVNGVSQSLLFRFPPRNVDPMAPVPKGSDAVASDGTMWTVNWYTEGYFEFTLTVLAGQDLTNWINLIGAAVGGQILTFYPDQSNLAVSATCRLMVTGRMNSSGAPAVDPRPKWRSPGVFEIQCVMRFEYPLPLAVPAAPALSATAGGTIPGTSTYYAKVTLVNQTGETTASAEATIVLGSDYVPTVASPAPEANATGYNVYMGLDPGAETKQNAAPIAIGTAWTMPTSGLVAGAAYPAADTSGMAQIFNVMNGLAA